MFAYSSLLHDWSLPLQITAVLSASNSVSELITEDSQRISASSCMIAASVHTLLLSECALIGLFNSSDKLSRDKDKQTRGICGGKERSSFLA